VIRHSLSALLSHWRKQPLQLATLIIGLALATALWSAVQAVNGQAKRSYAAAASVFGGDAFDTLVDATGGVITIETYVALRRSGWLVSPVIERDLQSAGNTLRIVGLEPLTAPPASLPAQMRAAMSGNPAQLLMLPGLGFAAPELIATRPQDASGSVPLPVLRPSPDVPAGTIVTDIGTARALVGDGFDRLLVQPDQPLLRPALADVAPRLIRQSAQSTSDIGRLTDSFHLNLTAFGLLSFVVGLFIVHAGIGLAFEQRRGLLRTLRALGVPLRVLVSLLLGELVGLALLAGAIGVGLGYLIAGALLPDVAATLRGLYGASVSGGLEFRPQWALAGLGIALLGSVVAAADGLWSVVRMPLLSSAQTRAWSRHSTRSITAQATIGLTLMLGGAVAAFLFDGLLAGFALLGGLLMGAALVLPAVLSAALTLAARLAKTAKAQWFWADTQQQLRGLSLALMALMLALATNVGVGTMVSSFRLTFTGWLDQRLASELYVTARTNEEGAAIQLWLDGRADAVLPIWSVGARLGNREGEIYGIVDHATYRDHWPLLTARPDVWDSLQTGQSALINEQLARRQGLSAGDKLMLEPGWRVVVAGVYSDFGNPAGQAIVGLNALTARHPDLPRLRFGIRIPPEQAERLQSGLIDALALEPAQITDQAAIKAFSLGVFERTFTVTSALNVLTLSVAGFAILTSLLTLATIRLPQLAPVWALGITRAELSRLEVLRSLVLAGLTCAVALPVGLMLAWVLLAVVNVEAFGWRLPMFVFPAQWAILMALALLAALFASALPVWRLSRMQPADFLKVFANER
jgi:putative ABC transport system permease protein